MKARLSLLLGGLLCALSAVAGATAPSAADQATATAQPAVVLAQAAAPGVQSANIFEVKPAASEDPGYATQTNGERAQVQPGNNAPMWRQVGGGVTGYSSLPVTQAPEAGNLIQPFVQYPGSRVTNAGEAWRQVRNQWILPYGGSLLLIALLALGIFTRPKASSAVTCPIRVARSSGSRPSSARPTGPMQARSPCWRFRAS